jgi:hypothetical protein
MQAKQQILDLLDLIHGTDMCWPRTAGSGRLVVRLGGGERESWKMKANTRSVSIETEIPRGLPASECVRQHRRDNCFVYFSVQEKEQDTQNDKTFFQKK